MVLGDERETRLETVTGSCRAVFRVKGSNVSSGAIGRIGSTLRTHRLVGLHILRAYPLSSHSTTSRLSITIGYSIIRIVNSHFVLCHRDGSGGAVGLIGWCTFCDCFQQCLWSISRQAL